MGLLDKIAPFTQPISGIAQGIINAIQTRKNTQRTIEANKAQAEYAYSKDLEMWNRGNAYNSPQAQMERLKSAGLNPNLVYGSGSVAGQAAGALPKYNAPTMDYSHNAPINVEHAGGAMQQFQDLQIRQAQIDNMNAQRHAINAETEIKKLEAFKRLQENNYREPWLQGRNTIQGQQQGLNIQRESLNQQKFMQEFFKTEKQPELFKTQMDALAANVKLRRQAYDQNNRMLQPKINALNAATRGKNIQADWMPTTIQGTLARQAAQNALTAQQAETARLNNETYYTRMFGTAAMNIFNTVKSKAPLQPGKKGMTTPPNVTPKTEGRRTHPAYRVKGKR